MCHTLACTASGEVYSWGCGINGELGHGDLLNRHSPELIEALVTFHVSTVSAGDYHSLALSARDGIVFSWGQGRAGRLGHGDEASRSLPTPVTALSRIRVSALAAGSSHTIAIGEDRGWFAWGALEALG